MKVIKFVIGILLKIQLFFIIAVLMISFIPRIWGVYPYVVLSGSMEPAIHTGSLAYVDTTYDYERLKIGDVVAYEPKKDTMVTHRIIGEEKGVFETKGDNNDVSDGLSVYPDNYKGLTVTTIPVIGYFISFISGGRGLILFVAVALALFLMEYMLDYIQEKEKEEAMKDMQV